MGQSDYGRESEMVSEIKELEQLAMEWKRRAEWVKFCKMGAQLCPDSEPDPSRWLAGFADVMQEKADTRDKPAATHPPE